jgi:hypothetical protein
MNRPYRADASRRSFLRAVGGLAASAAIPQQGLPLATSLAGLAALSSQSSHAATTTGYKALVCLYMNGGSDTHNWVVPIDASGYAEYASSRAELAWAANRLQGITTTNQAAGRSFGMPMKPARLRSSPTLGRWCDRSPRRSTPQASGFRASFSRTTTRLPPGKRWPRKALDRVGAGAWATS